MADMKKVYDDLIIINLYFLGTYIMTDTRFRLVVMGDSYVGKSSIIKRFLYGTFNIDYVATVEDLFSQDFEVGGTCLKVDILDTAGDAQFPAMRRYIRNWYQTSFRW